MEKSILEQFVQTFSRASISDCRYDRLISMYLLHGEDPIEVAKSYAEERGISLDEATKRVDKIKKSLSKIKIHTRVKPPYVGS